MKKQYCGLTRAETKKRLQLIVDMWPIELLKVRQDTVPPQDLPGCIMQIALSEPDALLGMKLSATEQNAIIEANDSGDMPKLRAVIAAL